MTRENRTGVFEMPNDPELPDLFRVALREASLLLRTHTIARVTAYDPETQTVDVSVEALQVIRDNLSTPVPGKPNPTKTQAPTNLKNIKVAWPRTGAGYITFPLVPGDTGELHVQDRSIDLWRNTGIASDPRSAFAHMLGDSVFHPNLRPDTNPIAPPTSLTATVVEGPEIHLGSNAVDLVALATLVDSVVSVLDTVFRSGWVVVPNDGGAALKTAYLAAFPSPPASVAATKTRAE